MTANPTNQNSTALDSRTYPNRLPAEAVSRFAIAFRGLKRAYGGVDVWIKQPLTLDVYRGHLEGRWSMGIGPLTDDAQCGFGAVDIDTGAPAAEHTRAVFDELRNLGITHGLHIFTSKRKGFHVVVFFDGWTPAGVVRAVLKDAVRAAGLDPKTEVFPKQNAIPAPTVKDGKVTEHFGNYLNLPYFGKSEPGRRCEVDPTTGQTYTLTEFLDRLQPFPADVFVDVVANGLEVPGDDQDQQTEHKSKSDDELVNLFTSTYGDGFRRNALVSVINVLRSRGLPEDAVVALVMPWAEEHFDPKSDPSEIERQIRDQYRRYGERQPRQREKWDPIILGSWQRRSA